MDFLSGSNDIGTLGLGLLIAGAAAGLFSGVLGKGTGLILVPALFLVARSAGMPPDKAMALAAGTSFACMVPLMLSALATHGRSVDWVANRRAAVPLALGLAAGIATTLALPAARLPIFAFTALAATGATVWVAETRARTPNRLAEAAIALLQGGLAGAVGLGGGSLGAPLLMANGLERAKANATAGAFATVIVFAGALAAVWSGWDAPGLPRYSYGYVNLMAFAVIAPVAFVTNLIAAHYADMLEAKKLRLLFAAFVVLSVVRMAWNVAG